jgi:electron transfer flavoprotein alpha subunit
VTLPLALVAVETDADGVTLVSLETLTLARELAGTVDAVLVATLGEPRPDVLEQLGAQGVATVHVTSDERLSAFAPAGWAAAVADVARATGADAVLAAGTERGSTVMAHVAVRLGVAMAANVTTVASTDPVTVHRQVAGGAALEETRLTDAVAVLTVAGHACDPVAVGAPTTPAVSSYEPSLTDADLVVRVVRTEPVAADHSAALGSARVVVGAGRGVGSAAGFAGVLELTELLGGALGVSRVVTSLGWRPHHEQVGQTGSRISPDLYVACGISGAIQHWAGMSSSKTIVAINTDPDAPMVTKAHYAVIGDLHEVVPAVNEEIRNRRS